MAKLPNIVEKERSAWSVVLFAFAASLKGAKRMSIFRYLTASLAAAFSFVQFGALAVVVNEFVVYGIDGARLWVLAGCFAALALAELLPAIFTSFQNYCQNVQVNDMQRHLQSLEFNKMHELDVGTVEQPEFQNILENVSQRGWQSLFSILNIITFFIGNAVSLVVSAISLAIVSPLVLAVILVASLPTYFLERQGAMLSARLWKENAERNRVWRSKRMPLLNKNSLIELKNFGLVHVFLQKFLETVGSFHKEARGIYKKQLQKDIIARLLLTLGYAVAFVLLIHSVYAGALAVGGLVFSFSVVSRFQNSINNLFDNLGRMAEHTKNVGTFMDLLEMEPLIVSGAKMLNASSPVTVEFRNVSFAYPNAATEVLHDISFTIAPGEELAIVGLNGAGKTTLIRLLTRVYDPTGGDILVNGVPLKEYDLASWKKNLGILLQEYALYSEETVAENIMLGDTHKHNQHAVERSAQEATIHEHIASLPKGYNQRVGTEFRGGVEFSKGEKQKVALARVLYRNAPFIILDEPTASVDALSEDAIFKNLRAHEGQTRLIVSHKFSNVRNADTILLLKDGRVLEKGSHEELMAQGGAYKELFLLQAKGFDK